MITNDRGFVCASDEAQAESDEKPRRRVFLPAFYIDVFEVTNRRYREFRKEHTFPGGEEDLPVTFIFKPDAEAYCRFVGARLPTNEEWEKAARGTDGRIYPWGNVFQSTNANINPRAGDARRKRPCTSHSRWPS